VNAKRRVAKRRVCVAIHHKEQPARVLLSSVELHNLNVTSSLTNNFFKYCEKFSASPTKPEAAWYIYRYTTTTETVGESGQTTECHVQSQPSISDREQWGLIRSWLSGKELLRDFSRLAEISSYGRDAIELRHRSRL
jgi:hypothetical protein